MGPWCGFVFPGFFCPFCCFFFLVKGFRGPLIGNLKELSFFFFFFFFPFFFFFAVFFSPNDGTPITEDAPYGPQPYNHYGLTKYVGEMIVRDQLDGSNTDYAIVRIADIYGPKQRTGALLQAVIGNIVAGNPQKKYGIGDRTRDYTYIDDVARGLAHVAVKRLSGIYNLCTGKGTSVARIIEIAEEISDCKGNRQFLLRWKRKTIQSGTEW